MAAAIIYEKSLTHICTCRLRLSLHFSSPWHSLRTFFRRFHQPFQRFGHSAPNDYIAFVHAQNLLVMRENIIEVLSSSCRRAWVYLVEDYGSINVTFPHYLCTFGCENGASDDDGDAGSRENFYVLIYGLLHISPFLLLSPPGLPCLLPLYF